MLPCSSTSMGLYCDQTHALPRYSTAIIMQLITGEEILKPDDEYVLVADQVNAAMSNGPAVGAAGLDFFPWRELPLITGCWTETQLSSFQ